MFFQRRCWRLNALVCLLTITVIFPGYNSAKYLRVQFMDEDETICEATGEPVLTNGDGVEEISSPVKAILFARSSKAATRSRETEGDIPAEGEWAAVLDFVDNLGTVKQTSILDEVKNAFLLGASAVVLLAMNADYLRKFDKAFTKPVIAISTNITRILKALSRSTTIFLVATWYETMAKERSQYFSKLTLWSTCGRMSAMGYFPWEGTICMEPEGEKANQDFFWTVYYAGILLLCLLLHMKTRRHVGEDENDESNQALARCRQLAAKRLKNIRCTKYKSQDSLSSGVASRSCSGSRERPYRSIESHHTCAICLDDYRPNQTIRVLPCSHRFHSLCVDGWLVDRQTCPLCIVNVFELLPK